jgi:hypothetical protein
MSIRLEDLEYADVEKLLPRLKALRRAGLRLSIRIQVQDSRQHRRLVAKLITQPPTSSFINWRTVGKLLPAAVGCVAFVLVALYIWL